MGDFKLGRVPASKWEIYRRERRLPFLFFVGGILVEEFKIYSVSDRYIEYLRVHVPNVYSNKVENRVHTRKYVGVVFRIGE